MFMVRAFAVAAPKNSGVKKDRKNKNKNKNKKQVFHYSNVSSYVLVEYIGKDLNKLSALGENSHTLNFRHVAHVFIRRNPMLL